MGKHRAKKKEKIVESPDEDEEMEGSEIDEEFADEEMNGQSDDGGQQFEVRESVNDGNCEMKSVDDDLFDLKDQLVKPDPNETKGKGGIIYLSFIPPGFNPPMLKRYFSKYGEVRRTYLRPVSEEEDGSKEKNTKKKKKISKFTRYAEGWIEYVKKRTAKKVSHMLNGTQVGGKRRAQHYDCIWSIKYLHRFKWHHLTSHIIRWKSVREQKLRYELEQAKKETNFYLEMAEKSKRRLANADNIMNRSQAIKLLQRKADQPRDSDETGKVEGVDVDLLDKIFG